MTNSQVGDAIEQKSLSGGGRWEELQKVARLVVGTLAPQGKDSFSDSGTWFVRVSDLAGCDFDGILMATRDRLSELAIATKPLVRVPKGAVVLPKSGAAIATNRRAILGMDAYIVGHLLALIPIPEMILTEWLYFALRQIDMVEFSENASYPSLKKSAVAKIEIPLPPLSEQKRIVAILKGRMGAVERARMAALDRVEAARALGAAFLREIFSFENGNSLPGNWQRVAVNSAIVKIKYTTKIQKRDYLKKGNYPIIDQSQKFISGYWNDENALFRVKEPVIIFGDHTRITKYVDFDFVLGADGVKILQPHNGIDARFFYYALKSISIESLGYSRHYKALQNQQIPLPPLSEQRQIVATLDAKMAIAEKARAAAEAELEAMEALPGALLRQAFKGEL